MFEKLPNEYMTELYCEFDKNRKATSKERILFDQQGFLVINNFFTDNECEAIITAFQDSIKYSEKEFYRIKSNSPEQNRFTKSGFVVNPLMNLHLENDTNISDPFLKLFNSNKAKSFISSFDNREFELYKTMYFESNRGTEQHFDSLIFKQQQRMLGVWVALEDISPKNGGFFVYPRTHKLLQPGYFSEEIDTLFGKYRILSSMKQENYESQNSSQMLCIYKEGKETLELILEKIKSSRFGPELKKGDAILFDGNILHGSFRPESFDFSRNSTSAHYLTK